MGRRCWTEAAGWVLAAVLAPAAAAAAGPREAEPPPPAASAAAVPATAAAGGEVDAARRREEERLERVREEIEEIKQQLDRLEAREGSLLDTLDEIGLRSALLQRESEALGREIALTEERLAGTARETEMVSRRLRETEIALRGWLRDVYKAGPLRYLRLVAASSSPAQVAAARRVMEALSIKEARRMDEFRTDRRRLAEAEARLREDRLALVRLQDDLGRKTAEVVQNRRQKGALLADLRRRRASQKRMLLDLVQVEKDIQGLLERLARPEAQGPVPSLGFARHRGGLEWPARGSIAVPFGNVRHPRFGTEVPHPGIEIEATTGQAVWAVFDGRVVFSDWFRGYGQMVVIDHGDGYLSIYGHVDERLVAAGQMVRQGERIAHCGSGGSFEIPGVYFEIRHDGKPVDPAGWLRGNRVARSGPGATAAGRAPRGKP